MIGYIYCYTNKINGKKYIGQTTRTIKARAGKDGKYYLIDNNKEANYKFANAIRKYGWDNFIDQTLEIVSTSTKQELISELNKLEIFYISYYDSFYNGYNSDKGGNNKNCSEEAREKISKARKGMSFSKQTREKLSKSHEGKIPWNRGIVCSEETRKKISETVKKTLNEKVIIISEETREKMSKAHKGKRKGVHASLETREKMSKAHKGKSNHEMTSEIRDKISKTLKAKNIKPPSTKGHCWINNGIINKSIVKNLLDDYLNTGWCKGRLKLKKNKYFNF